MSNSEIDVMNLKHDIEDYKELVAYTDKQLQQLKQELQLEKDNVAELNELLIAEKEENEELKKEVQRNIKQQEIKDTYLKQENEKLKSELQDVRQIRKDMPDIQEPYVILYRQIKKENSELKELIKTIKPNGRYCDTHCSHFVLGECGQKHHDNCVGTDKCIKDLEQMNEELKEEISSLKQSLDETLNTNYFEKYLLEIIKE